MELKYKYYVVANNNDPDGLTKSFSMTVPSGDLGSIFSGDQQDKLDLFKACVRVSEIDANIFSLYKKPYIEHEGTDFSADKSAGEFVQSFMLADLVVTQEEASKTIVKPYHQESQESIIVFFSAAARNPDVSDDIATVEKGTNKLGEIPKGVSVLSNKTGEVLYTPK